MAKDRIFNLQETKGNFQLKGIVTGTKKDDFYKEKKTKTQRDMRMVKFGAEYTGGQSMYVNLQGVANDFVYFSKRAEEKGQPSTTEKVQWGDRFSYNREGFRLIGKNIGVKKIVDEKGNTVNDKKTLTDYDACKEIADNLKDGQSVFMRGSIDYSSFTDDKGNKITSTKLVPNQVSLCADVDFKDETFTQQNDFNQVIIFMGIEKEVDDKNVATGRFIVTAKIVTYSTIEDVEFVIENASLANKFKKTLKPYNAIRVNGHMVMTMQTETVQDDDEWGEADAMERPKSPVKREFIITGAKGNTLDKETYTQELVEEAMAKIAKANKAKEDFGSDFGSADGWGEVMEDEDDDDSAWA